MADDWQKGDLALCVNSEGWCEYETGSNCAGPQSGSVNEVTWAGTSVDVLGPCVALRFAPWPGEDEEFDAANFRKIHPLSIEERNAELRLLNVKEKVRG